MICFMRSQFCRTTQLVISDYGECIVLWSNRINANNHIASARPSLFSVQCPIKFSLYRTWSKEFTQVRGPLERFVTMHQASNNLWIFCITEGCASSSGQVSNVLLAFISTIILSFETRRNPWRYFLFFQDHLCVFKRGLRRVGSGFWVKSKFFSKLLCFLYVDKLYFLNLSVIHSLQFQPLYTAASTRKVTVPRE
jgi:hypothetical protein